MSRQVQLKQPINIFWTSSVLTDLVWSAITNLEKQSRLLLRIMLWKAQMLGIANFYLFIRQKQTSLGLKFQYVLSLKCYGSFFVFQNYSQNFNYIFCFISFWDRIWSWWLCAGFRDSCSGAINTDNVLSIIIFNYTHITSTHIWWQKNYRNYSPEMLCSKCIHPPAKTPKTRYTPTFHHTQIFNAVEPQPIKHHHCSATYHSSIFEFPQVQNEDLNLSAQLYMGPAQRKLNTNKCQHGKEENSGKCGKGEGIYEKVKLNYDSVMDTEKQNNLRIISHGCYPNISKIRKQIEMCSNVIAAEQIPKCRDVQLQFPSKKQFQKQVPSKPRGSSSTNPQKCPHKLHHSPYPYHAYHPKNPSSIRQQRAKPVYACIKRSHK